jgi:hypothetical protein
MATDPVLVPRPLIDAAASFRAVDLPGSPEASMSGDEWSRAYRRRRWAAGAMATVVLVASIVYGVHVHNQDRRTHSALVTARVQLKRTIAQLSSARTTLGTLTGQSAAAGDTLATDERRLESLQADLSRAEASQFFSGVNISTLDECLAGVERALNQVSLSDPAGAAMTLSGVSAVCAAANPGS